MQVSRRHVPPPLRPPAPPNHWLTCNGFPVILLPQTEPHYCATADVYLRMTSACQLQDSADNLAQCWVRKGALAPAQTQAAAEPGPIVGKLPIKCETALYTVNLCVDIDL